MREAASVKAGPTKRVEEPRLRAVTHFGVQARALACGAPLDIFKYDVKEGF